MLIHGIGGTPLSMRPLVRVLEREGYRVINWGYSSTCCGIAELGLKLQKDLEAARGAAHRIHFVGHSMGNIIVRWALTQERPPTGVGRVVMITPPNQGSHEADRFAPWVGWFLKPLTELRTDSASTARSVPAPTGVPFGIIAGLRDRQVSLAETHIQGEADHVSIAAGHLFLPSRSDVQRLTLAFLRHGRFNPQ